MAALLRLSLIALIVLFGTVGLAAPAPNAQAAVDAQLLTTFQLMEQYASAAYCPKNYNSPGDKVTCSSNSCQLVQSANTTTLVEFSSKLGTGVTGYVAVDDTNRLVVISFRGSNTFENWLNNLRLDLVNTNICNGCTVHRGFWQSWLDSRDGILAAIKGFSKTRPGYKLVTTGHSLGGALAAIAAAQLRKDGYSVGLYSFGAPRFGNSKFSDYVRNQPGGNYRVTHWNDPVPRVPPIIWGYAHISPEYYINKGNKKTVGPSDIKIYNGNVNLLGNTAWILTDIAAHLWYFNNIAQCAIDNIFG